MSNKLSDKLGSITVTSNPQSGELAGSIRPFAGDTSSWPVVNGVAQKNGWGVCEGAVVQQSDYPDLFANLGSTWDTFAHPVDGTPSVGAGQFALPNFKGLYLGGAGANGDSTLSLGAYAGDLTGKNGLTNSTSSLSGTSGGSKATWASANITTNTDSHYHFEFVNTYSNTGNVTSSTYPVYHYDANSDPEYIIRGTTSAPNVGRSSTDTHSHTFNKNLLNSNQNSHTHSISGTAAAQTITGDAETRPKTAPVVYIIALYNNTANVVSTKNVTTSGDLTVGGKIVGGEATAEQAGIVTWNDVGEKSRNLIINGGKDLYQRTTSGAIGSGYVTSDRFYKEKSGSSTTINVTRQTDVPDANIFDYSDRHNVAATSGGAGLYLQTRLEAVDIKKYIGKQMCFSLYAKGTDSTVLKLKVYSTTTKDVWTSDISLTPDVEEFSKTISLTSDWVRYDLTFVVPATCANGIALGLESNSDVSLNVSDDVYETGWQLEVGSEPTEFKRAGQTYAGELALCQRYTLKLSSSSTNPVGFVHLQTGFTYYCMIPTPVKMRSMPSLITQSTSGDVGAVRGVTGNHTFAYNSLPMPLALKENGVVVSEVAGASVGQGIALIFYGNSDIFFDAEL